MVNKNYCNYCTDRWFSSKSNLNRHIKDKHKPKESPTKNQIETCSFICLEGCNVSFEDNWELRSHLQLVHNIDPEEEEYIFDNIGEFNEWLNELEDTFGYKYVRKNLNLNSKFQPADFYCQTIEISKEKNDSKKINLSDKGTCGVGCTSQIRLTQDKGKCLVTYFKAHYGHSTEPQNLRIPNDVDIKVESQAASCKSNKSLKIKEKRKTERYILPKTNNLNNITTFQICTNIVGKSISTTKRQDDSIKDHRNGDAEKDCTIKIKKQKVVPNFLFNSPVDSQSSFAKSEDIIQNIQTEILRLREHIKTEKNMKVLSHVLETLTTENNIIAALKQEKFEIM